jgi:hypothetical protein
MVSKELRHTYGELVSDPNTWKSSAKQLSTAAAKFERRIRRMWDRELSGTGIASAYKRKHDAETAYLQNIYMMLLGFAVENNIKAIIAKKYQEIVRTTAQKSGKLPDLLKSHDLPKLARRAGLELNTHESGVLRRLTASVTWAGRYPVAVSLSESSGGSGILKTISSSDVDEIQDILRSIEEQV